MAKHKVAYAGSAIALMLGSGMFTPLGAFAAANELAACIAGSDAVCTLNDDLTLTETIGLTRDVTIDLNGHDITATGAIDAFYVQGANVEVTGTGSIVAENYSPFEIEGSTDSTATNYSVLTIGENVTLKSVKDYTIWMSGAVDSDGARHGYGAVVNMNGTSDSMYGYYINGGVQDVAENAPIFNFGSTANLVSQGHAIYAAGYGHWNLNGATINAEEGGIGIKAGTVTLNDANIKVTGDYSAPEAYGNGINESGAVIQIEGNDGYSDNVEISINGGKYESSYSNIVLEYKEKAETQNSVKKFSITGGNFVVSDKEEIFNVSDNFTLTKFITGGVYSAEVPSAYIADGYAVVEDAGGYEVVKAAEEIVLNQGYDVEAVYSNESVALGIKYTPEDAVVDFEVTTDKPELFWEQSPRIIQDEGKYGVLLNVAETGSGEATVTVTDKISGKSASIKVNVIESIRYDRAETEDGVIADVFFSQPVEGENLAVEIAGEEMTDEEKAEISPFLKAVYDISVVNQNTDEVVPVSDNEINIDLVLKNSDYEDMNYFKIVYIDDEGKIAEVFDTEVTRNSEYDWLVLSFTTTHLSSYGVLASETEFPEILTPDTGAFAGNANMSGDYRGLVATVVAMTVMTVAMEIALYRKNHAKNVK